ncbi:MAG: hypothetical protein VW266_00950, partial [Flavobacteriales bacterium]
YLKRYKCLIEKSYTFFCCTASVQTIEPIAFDRRVTQEGWANTQKFEITYEIQPGNNIPAKMCKWTTP